MSEEKFSEWLKRTSNKKKPIQKRRVEIISELRRRLFEKEMPC